MRKLCGNRSVVTLSITNSGRLVWEILLKLQKVLAVVLALYIAALVVAEVIFRYFLHLSLLWLEEIVLYAVFWLYFIGIALCTNERTHIKAGLMRVIFKGRPKILNSIELAVTLLSLGLSCYSIYWAYDAFIVAIEVHKTLIHLRVTTAYAILSLLPGFILTAIYFLAEAVHLARNINHKTS